MGARRSVQESSQVKGVDQRCRAREERRTPLAHGNGVHAAASGPTLLAIHRAPGTRFREPATTPGRCATALVSLPGMDESIAHLFFARPVTGSNGVVATLRATKGGDASSSGISSKHSRRRPGSATAHTRSTGPKRSGSVLLSTTRPPCVSYWRIPVTIA